MSRPSIVGRRPGAVVLGWIVGVLTGMLFAAPVYWRASSSSEHGALSAKSEAVALHVSAGESRNALLESLPALCEDKRPATVDGFGGDGSGEGRSVIVWGQANSGIKNAQRLLPLAKRLTFQALRDAGATYRMHPAGVARVQRRIDAVNRVVLDPRLGHSGEVRDERPREIRVGPDYAMMLTSDDEVIFLLAHELTHVATWSGKLGGFVERLAGRAELGARAAPTRPRKEDLACEFVAVLAFKRFVGSRPTEESKAERLSRILGYASPARRLQFAWEDFCFSYYADQGYRGDAEHLGEAELHRALRGLDPELRVLVPADSLSPPP